MSDLVCEELSADWLGVEDLSAMTELVAHS